MKKLDSNESELQVRVPRIMKISASQDKLRKSFMLDEKKSTLISFGSLCLNPDEVANLHLKNGSNEKMRKSFIGKT